MCNACSSYGWIVVVRDGVQDRPDVQRCDVCQKFSSDGHARVALHEAWFDLECVRRQSKSKGSPDQYWADEERRWTESADYWGRSVEDWRRLGGPYAALRITISAAHLEHARAMIRWARSNGKEPMPQDLPEEIP